MQSITEIFINSLGHRQEGYGVINTVLDVTINFDSQKVNLSELKNYVKKLDYNDLSRNGIITLQFVNINLINFKNLLKRFGKLNNAYTPNRKCIVNIVYFKSPTDYITLQIQYDCLNHQYKEVGRVKEGLGVSQTKLNQLIKDSTIMLNRAIIIANK